MHIRFYGIQSFEIPFLEQANQSRGHALAPLETNLSEETAALAEGFEAVSIFANDRADAAVLEKLAQGGTKLLLLRMAGFNHVDLAAAARLGITVARVPAYSPHAIAEHTVGLMLMLNRKLHRAHTRVREGNFSLQGLMGFDLHGKTVGLVGTGRIGEATARILAGFGCRLLGHDVRENPACVALGMRYVELPELFSSSDVISLHCPLTPATHHLVDDRALALMKPGVMLINTSRGAVIDTRAAIRGLKSGRIGYLGLDVYEEEGDLFFQDLSETVIQDDVFSRLQTFPNVVITAHQAFFTREAVQAIQTTTLENASGFERGSVPQENVVGLALVAKRS
jgi:D-lactate dehydrogenase